MKTGLELIAKERRRQVEKIGWSAEHDDNHKEGELAMASATYIAPEKIYYYCEAESDFFINSGDRGDRRLQPAQYRFAWPFDEKWYKPTPEDRIREIVKGLALGLAEIDRLQRLKNSL